MNFFKKILRSKKMAENNQDKNLIEWLDANNIIYQMSETETGYKIIYSDVFDKVRFEIIFDGNRYSINGRHKKESDIKVMLLEQNMIDSSMEEFMYSPENDKLIQMFDFFKKAFLNTEIVFELSINAQDELELGYHLSNKKVFYPLIKINKDNEKICSTKNKNQFDCNDAVISIIKEMMRVQPLLFEGGDFKTPENTAYSDVVKQYLMNRSLEERLNKTKNIEAKLIMVNGNSTLFVIFKNGAALEYISPTKQMPQGQFIIIDVDEDTTLEDNEEYWISKKILRIPDSLSDKPDENNLPIRKTGNKKSLKLK